MSEQQKDHQQTAHWWKEWLPIGLSILSLAVSSSSAYIEHFRVNRSLAVHERGGSFEAATQIPTPAEDSDHQPAKWRLPLDFSPVLTNEGNHTEIVLGACLVARSHFVDHAPAEHGEAGNDMAKG